MGSHASVAAAGHHAMGHAARGTADRAAGLGARQDDRAEGSGGDEIGCRHRELGHRARALALHAPHVRVRSDVDSDSGGHGRRRGPGKARDGSVIPLTNYLVLSAVLFSIGTAGVFMRRNLITILLSIEIMLNAVNLSFVAFGRAAGDLDGQIITFFVMTVAAAEAAVGLALVIALFRHKESLNPDAFTTLKW